jgi:hypothetical protein
LAGVVFRVANPRIGGEVGQQRLQCVLPLDQRQSTQIPSIKMKQVECEVEHPVGPTL